MCFSWPTWELNPGCIPELKGRLTKQCYHAAIISVDHYSSLSYIQMQWQLTSNETLEAKNAFKAVAWHHYIKVWHYHANNGRFADTTFIKNVTWKGQTISYCGVNTHFQNGIAVKQICNLQEQARKQLLHAKVRWPSAIKINLWPSALCNAN